MDKVYQAVTPGSGLPQAPSAEPTVPAVAGIVPEPVCVTLYPLTCPAGLEHSGCTVGRLNTH